MVLTEVVVEICLCMCIIVSGYGGYGPPGYGPPPAAGHVQQAYGGGQVRLKIHDRNRCTCASFSSLVKVKYVRLSKLCMLKAKRDAQNKY